MESVLLSPIRLDELEILIQKSVTKGLAENGVRNTQPLDEVLDIDEAAQLCKLKKNTIYDFVAKNKIPYTKPGKHLLFFRSDLMIWLASFKRNTGQDTAETEFLAANKNRIK